MEATEDTEHRTAFLGKDRIFPLLLKMGIPAAVAMLVNALYNIVDTIFVGQGVGPLAIAALSIVFPVQMIVSSFAQAMGVGASSIVSRRLGERKPQDAAAAIGNAYALIGIGSTILVALLMLFLRPVLGFFGASEGIMPYALEYASVVAPGFFFFGYSVSASYLVRSEGNAKDSMKGMLVGAILNCFLDPLFIFGFHMGVAGAGIATVISQIAASTYLFSLYFRHKTHVRLSRKDFRIRGDLFKESAILGAPAFVQSAGMSLLALIINTSLGFYGGDQAISIYGMINRLIMLVIFPILGIVQGFQPIVGYNYGARHYDRVRVALKVTVATVTALSLFFWAVMMLFPTVCTALFTSDRELIASSSAVLRVMALFVPLAALQITGANYFQAIGKKNQSFFLGLSRQFLVLIPLVVVLPRFIGIDGIWRSFPTADLISTVITSILLVRELRHLKAAPQGGATEVRA